MTSATASSIRCGSRRAEQTRFAAARAERSSGNYTVFQSGVYTACEPCKDDPKKPPKWQVKAARIIHDQGEKMMYFENARLEFFGVPLAYMPYFSAPDPTVKRKTGVLVPMFSSSSVYGVGVAVPYYWALAPDYDFTFTPMITSRQGPLLQGEWRQRLVNGSYTIRASGMFQLDKDVFCSTRRPYRDWRGSIETSGQFNLSGQWVWGWDGTLLSDKTYFQDYGFNKSVQTANALRSTPDYALSQLYLAGRGERSYFDARALYFYGFSLSDDQKQIPVVHPVIDHDYVFKYPIMGGEARLPQQFHQPVAGRPPISIRSRRRPSPATCARRPRPILPQEYEQLPAARRPRQLQSGVVRGLLAALDHRSVWPGLHALRHDARRCRHVAHQHAAGRGQLPQRRRHQRRTRHADGRSRVPLSAHRRAVLGHADLRADRPIDLPPQ